MLDQILRDAHDLEVATVLAGTPLDLEAELSQLLGQRRAEQRPALERRIILEEGGGVGSAKLALAVQHPDDHAMDVELRRGNLLGVSRARGDVEGGRGNEATAQLARPIPP